MTIAEPPSMGRDTYGLSDFIRPHVDRRPGPPLYEAGPLARRLTESLGDRDKVNSLMATAFWQVFRYSSALERLATAMDLPIEALGWGEHIVVYRADLQRFDLLVFTSPDHFLGPRRSERGHRYEGFIRAAPVTMTGEDISVGLRTWPFNVGRTGPYLSAELAQEVAEFEQHFAIVVTTPPEAERLALPNPACVISTPRQNGTAGIVARDVYGRTGVTTALHVVEKHRSVMVAGVRGRVVEKDVTSDSCFIEVDPLPVHASGPGKGFMAGLLPRGSQPASFDGGVSGPSSTIIDGWSLELPTISPHNQLKVYTPRIANPGDSGSALVSDDDYLVGFAFESSRPGQAKSFTSWIWAHAVCHALDITPL